MTKALRELTELLVDEIPIEIQSIKSRSKICCIRLYYFDTHAPCGYINLRVMFAKDRDRLFEESDNAIYQFWASEEHFGRGPEIQIGSEGKPEYRSEELLAAIYPTLGSSRGMKHYRAALAKACKALNELDWLSFANVSDDFVIAIADGSKAYDDEFADLKASMSAWKLKMLQEEELLGDGDTWDVLDDQIDHEHQAAIEDSWEAETEKIESMAKTQQLKYCTTAIGRYVKQQKHQPDFGPSFYREFLESKSGVEALVEDVLLENVGRKPTGGALDQLREILWELPKWKIKSKKSELLLKRFVKQAHADDSKRRHSTRHAFFAAECLYSMYKGYPKPTSNADNGRLENVDEFV